MLRLSIRRGWVISVGCVALAAFVGLVTNLVVSKNDSVFRVHRGPGYDHFYMVARTAVSVANPEFRVSRRPAPPDQPADLFSVGVDIEPHWARSQESLLTRPYEIVKMAGGNSVHTVQAETLAIKKPVFPSSRTRDLLQKMGSVKKVGKPEVSKLLGTFGRNMAVTAIIEYAKPMAPDEQENIGSIGGDNILISFDRGAVPFYWDGGLQCDERRDIDTCQNVSLFDGFRRWVSLLQPEDGGTLGEFGLDREYLRDAADRGRIVGHIESNRDSRTLDYALQDPKVKTVHVIEARLNCNLGSGDVCETKLWPAN
jgi:hypothetical protein